VIKFTGRLPNGDRLIGLALEARNIELLQQDRPILVRSRDLEIPEPAFEILVLSAESETARKWLESQRSRPAAKYEPHEEEEHYPLGKLRPDDQGVLPYHVVSEGGRVILSFPKSVRWIGLDREATVRLIDSLRKHLPDAH
jgi:hypothetical protein